MASERCTTSARPVTTNGSTLNCCRMTFSCSGVRVLTNSRSELATVRFSEEVPLAGLLGGSSARKDAVHDFEIPLVTRVLVDRCVGLFETNHDGPWLRPSRWISERHPVVDPVRSHAREALDKTQMLA